MHGEGVDLHPVDLVAGEGARQRVDADVLRLDVAGGLVDLAIEGGRLDPAAFAVDGAQRCVLAEQRQDMQAALDQFLERDAVVLGDRGQADVEFVLVVLGAEIERRAGFGQRAEPVLAGDMGDVLHQFDDALAGAAFAGEQPDLIERHAIPDRPLAFRDGLVVPVGHVEPLQRLGRRCVACAAAAP